MINSRTNTLFLDIDGCIFIEPISTKKEYFKKLISENIETITIEGVQEFLADWMHKGNKLILTTGRPECMRLQTENHLKSAGILYDQLIMDAGTGIRILVNNSDDTTSSRSLAINIPTNDKFYTNDIIQKL